jgi:chromosome segregation ATPase
VLNSPIGGFQPPKTELPNASSPEVSSNPFFGLEDKVNLGSRDSSPGIYKNARFASPSDRYEPWPKDPKDDFEKQKRKEWLKGEIDKLRDFIKNAEAHKRDKESAIYSLANEIDSLKNENRRLGEEYNREDERRASLEIEFGRTKREHRRAQEQDRSDEAWRLIEKMQRLQDEISRAKDRLSNLNSKRNDLESKINDRTRQRENLQNEVYRISETISRESWTLREREQEYRNLGG